MASIEPTPVHGEPRRSAELDVLGPADAGERVPAADRPHPCDRRGRRGEHRGDSVGRARGCTRCTASARLVAGPVAPAFRSRARAPSRVSVGRAALTPPGVETVVTHRTPCRVSRRQVSVTGTPAGERTTVNVASDLASGSSDGTADLDPPFAVGRPGRLDANADDLVAPGRRASRSGWPASRCAAARCCAGCWRRPGFAGILAYTLPEALWLADGADPVSDDVVVGYPIGRPLGAAPAGRRPERGRPGDADGRLGRAARPHRRRRRRRRAGRPCASAWTSTPRCALLGGRVHVGVRRSPRALRGRGRRAGARGRARRPGFSLVGLMAYEAQIAGVGTTAGPAVARARASARMQARRAPRARRARGPRWSPPCRPSRRWSSSTAAAPAASSGPRRRPRSPRSPPGSGLYGPTLFDGYRAFRARRRRSSPLPVVRRPRAGHRHGGRRRLDRLRAAGRRPAADADLSGRALRCCGTEGAGEVQTPLRGPAAGALRVGDRVWFRHAKAGELCERVDELHTGRRRPGDRRAVPTYRGEAPAFG